MKEKALFNAGLFVFTTDLKSVVRAHSTRVNVRLCGYI